MLIVRIICFAKEKIEVLPGYGNIRLFCNFRLFRNTASPEKPDCSGTQIGW